MNIIITVGHSRLRNGSYTSADGRRYGGCNEYIWCKKFSKQLQAALKKKGHKVRVVICPEKKFTSAAEEKEYKLGIINSGHYDLVMELHLNAAGRTAAGCEVLYKSNAGKKYAATIQKGLSKTFDDRGIKQRNDLYILNGSRPVAVLLETFFCTNKRDYAKAKGIVKRRKIAKDIADAL